MLLGTNLLVWMIDSNYSNFFMQIFSCANLNNKNIFMHNEDQRLNQSNRFCYSFFPYRWDIPYNSNILPTCFFFSFGFHFLDFLLLLIRTFNLSVFFPSNQYIQIKARFLFFIKKSNNLKKKTTRFENISGNEAI